MTAYLMRCSPTCVSGIAIPPPMIIGSDLGCEWSSEARNAYAPFRRPALVDPLAVFPPRLKACVCRSYPDRPLEAAAGRYAMHNLADMRTSWNQFEQQHRQSIKRRWRQRITKAGMLFSSRYYSFYLWSKIFLQLIGLTFEPRGIVRATAVEVKKGNVITGVTPVCIACPVAVPVEFTDAATAKRSPTATVASFK